MIALSIILDTSQTPHTALAELVQRTGVRDGQALVDEGHLVYMQEDANISVGAMPEGTESGAPAVSFCFALPDGKVAVAETTLKLFLMAADAFKARYGDPR